MNEYSKYDSSDKRKINLKLLKHFKMKMIHEIVFRIRKMKEEWTTAAARGRLQNNAWAANMILFRHLPNCYHDFQMSAVCIQFKTRLVSELVRQHNNMERRDR